ncbi:MAG: polyribonucleotide nucleotidyltransferase, partial [Candidatus Omnitrophica bacterium]|nr:polyribonucleotide nucleotidyltransferase [Candidatus Omnitrophota bacterium]MBD3269236.1 polyribonucleotide nucleotidyltransferase [Candidatus Omnitrophota bacterium]
MAVSLSIPNIGARDLIFSTGELAKQADGSVSCSCGGTVVLSTVCMSKEPSPSKGFFPLTVEYREKTYAMGKIPGGFIKKEGRPKDEEILNARLIDRPLRPLFPKGFTYEVQIFGLVLSSDGENNPDVLALNAASCALFVSDIPFEKPIGAVRVSKLNGEFVVNPTYDKKQNSPLDLVVVGTEGKIIMLEGQLEEVSEEEVFEAIKFSRLYIDKIIKAQKDFRQKYGRKKREVQISAPSEELTAQIKEKIQEKLEDIYGLVKKEERESKIQEILKECNEEFINEEAEIDETEIKKVFYSIEEEFVRKKILEEEKRPDSRGLKDIRPI